METVTEAEVAVVLPVIRASLGLAIEETLLLFSREQRDLVFAAWQVAMIEKAADFAKMTFATSRVDFVMAARELYEPEVPDGS